MGWNANFSNSHPRQSINFDLDNDGIPEIIDIWTPDSIDLDDNDGVPDEFDMDNNNDGSHR